MRVLLVGGAGFIGSHLSNALRRRGDIVAIYDLLSGHDAHDTTQLTLAMVNAELVVHLASNADIAKAVADPDIDFRDGTLLTRNVLESMRINGVRQLVYASGSGVYGDYNGVPFKEADECKPISPYGASKLAGEALIRAYCHMFDIRADMFRFANVVGPQQTHGVGYDFVRKLKKDPSRLDFLGNGRQSKSYIHVDDVISAIFTAIDQHDHSTALAYNVATEDTMTVLEIARMAVGVCVKAPFAVELRSGKGDLGWKGDVPVVEMNTDKIKELGWSPKHTSAEAMRLALEAMWEEVK